MSVWYQYRITCYGDEVAIAKFFKIKKEEVNFIDSFDFSFGAKNGAVPSIDKLVENNPDLIFLTEQQIECDTVNWWLQRFDQTTSQIQSIPVMFHSYDDIEINKLLLEEYEQQFPYLMKQHQKEGRPYEWKWFFGHYSRSSTFLSNHAKYQEMTFIMSAEDIEFDSAEPVTDD